MFTWYYKKRYTSKKVVPYIRVLGFNEQGKELLSGIAHANPKLELITSVRDYLDTSSNKVLKSMLEKDVFATDIYTLGYDYDSSSNLDFTTPIIKV